MAEADGGMSVGVGVAVGAFVVSLLNFVWGRITARASKDKEMQVELRGLSERVLILEYQMTPDARAVARQVEIIDRNPKVRRERSS